MCNDANHTLGKLYTTDEQDGDAGLVRNSTFSWFDSEFGLLSMRNFCACSPHIHVGFFQISSCLKTTITIIRTMWISVQMYVYMGHYDKLISYMLNSLYQVFPG